MINPFSWSEYAITDQSVYYLFKIFGSMNGVLCDPIACRSTSGTSTTLLGAMFKTFNGVVLAVGAMIVVYVTVMGVLKTAHEGEFMGKQWNTLWVPLRVVFGIGMLVPTSSGYSGIQIIMMWIIVQGIGAADFMWNSAFAAVATLGSPYGGVTLPTARINLRMQDLFKSLVCEATSKRSDPNPSGPSVDKGNYFCAGAKGDDVAYCKAPGFNEFYKSKGIQYPISFTFGPGASCGKLTICSVNLMCGNAPGTANGPDSLRCLACKAQVEAMTSKIIPVMTTYAEAFAKADYEYRMFFATSATAPATSSHYPWIYNYCQDQGMNRCVANSSFPNPSAPNAQSSSNNAAEQLIWKYYPDLEPALTKDGKTNFIDTFTQEYIASITNVVNDYISKQEKGISKAALLKDGWIFAGRYYFVIAQMQGNQLAAALPDIDTVSMDTTQAGKMTQFRNNFSAADVVVNNATGASKSGMPVDLAPIGGIQNAAAAATSEIAFQIFPSGGLAQGANPLTELSKVGIGMLYGAETLFGVFLGVTIGLSIFGNLDIFVLGTGIHNPVGPSQNTTYLVVVPLIFGLLAWMVSIGALIGIYVPMIPYVVFSMGAIGWLITTIEAMVAGPLVALGILSPSGHHEILGKAEPALSLLFSIFLRPTLMIFGMMTAMVFAPVAVGMIYAGFSSTAKLISVAWQADPLQGVLFIAVYVLLIITVLNKVFSIIHIVPDKVMRWISGHAAQEGIGGEGEALGEQKRGVEGAAGVAGGAMAGVRQTEGAGAKGAKMDAAGRERHEASQLKGTAKDDKTGGGGDGT